MGGLANQEFPHRRHIRHVCTDGFHQNRGLVATLSRERNRCLSTAALQCSWLFPSSPSRRPWACCCGAGSVFLLTARRLRRAMLGPLEDLCSIPVRQPYNEIAFGWTKKK